MKRKNKKESLKERTRERKKGLTDVLQQQQQQHSHACRRGYVAAWAGVDVVKLLRE